MKRTSAALLASLILVASCGARPGADTYMYRPAIASVETRGVLKGGMNYHFSKKQLKRMKNTPLDPQKFVSYLEGQWPLKRIRAYCRPENKWPEGYQNLVPVKRVLETNIHQGAKHEFDRIYVYVSQDDGKGTVYFSDAGRNWRRWTYSLNIVRANDHWAIIKDLPNDFMDRE